MASVIRYNWGAILLFDIENDPLEEHDLSATFPKLVQQMLAALVAFNNTHIDQSVEPSHGAKTTETCGACNLRGCSLLPRVYLRLARTPPRSQAPR